jgi:uncharacterized protein YcbK (DUF882 family)
MTPHFSLAELDCKCGCDAPARVLARLAELAEALEVLREYIGAPINVISGYRCPKRNVAVGGAPLSRHLYGDAADIQVDGFTGVQLLEVAEELIAAGTLPEGGLGIYRSKPMTLHYDCRGKRTRWVH